MTATAATGRLVRDPAACRDAAEVEAVGSLSGMPCFPGANDGSGMLADMPVDGRVGSRAGEGRSGFPDARERGAVEVAMMNPEGDAGAGTEGGAVGAGAAREVCDGVGRGRRAGSRDEEASGFATAGLAVVAMMTWGGESVGASAAGGVTTGGAGMDAARVGVGAGAAGATVLAANYRKKSSAKALRRNSGFVPIRSYSSAAVRDLPRCQFVQLFESRQASTTRLRSDHSLHPVAPTHSSSSLATGCPLISRIEIGRLVLFSLETQRIPHAGGSKTHEAVQHSGRSRRSTSRFD